MVKKETKTAKSPATTKTATVAKAAVKPTQTKVAKPAKVKEPKAALLAHGVGRRKSSVARVWLKRGNGDIIVNSKDYKSYFDTDIARLSAATPFRVYPQSNKYTAEINVYGGGLFSQADAVKLGIARALLQANEELRSLLRENNLLTVDSRVKERKKYGQKAARRKFQFVKR